MTLSVGYYVFFYLQPYHENTRSLNIGDFPLTVLPTSSRASLPIVMKLHHGGKPSHLHANLPLRFGRTSEVLQPRELQTSPKSSLNLPQRFGRSEVCSKCKRSGTPPSATLPQRFGRRNMQETVGRLPVHTLFSILATASKSLEEKIRYKQEHLNKWVLFQSKKGQIGLPTLG